MVLAGVVLKLGGYGLMRVIRFLWIPRTDFSFHLFIWVALVGGIYSGFICLRQIDMKRIVAYSSVSHIRLVWLVIMSDTSIGVLRSTLIMLSHGLCSSGLFMLVNLLYKQSGSRLFFYNTGYIRKSPLLCVLCFLLLRRNIGAPPRLNFFGEVLGYILGMFYSGFIVAIIGIIRFLGGGYSLYFYRQVCYGKRGFYRRSLMLFSLIDCFVLLVHWLPLNLAVLVLPFI